MFSNRSRRRTAWVTAALLVLLCGWWSWLQVDGRVGTSRLMKRPETLDGQQIVLSLVEVIAVHGSDHYEVEKGTTQLDITGATAGLEIGEEGSIGGVFHASEMRLDEDWRVRAMLRPWKRGLGILGLLLCGVLMWVGIGRRGRELVVHG